MKSPFPGMHPWLEAHWGDVHTRLVVEASNQIQRQLPAGLKVSVDDLDYTEDPAPALRGKDIEAVAQLLQNRHER